jgi:oligoribonuclease NrnB/cAMP/cGMP phosphodiesterase (DHH superfamily)
METSEENPPNKPRTIVLYHGNCPDGFGGAYAAWKKFGDAAEYISLHRDAQPLEDFTGAHLYFIDFCYPQEIMDEFIRVAAKVTMLDHHDGMRDVIEKMPEYRYDVMHSGATLAWNYFHPETSTPKLLEFVEDDDTYHFALPETRAVLCYVTAQPMTFESWDKMAKEFDDPATSSSILEKANIYAEYFEILANIAVDKAQTVMFEGYECYFATSHPLNPLSSLVGNKLARKKPPIGLIVRAHPNGYGVSIRGDGSVDVAAIAQKYGGNGHTSSAGFLIPADKPLPWTLVPKETDTEKDKSGNTEPNANTSN